MKPFFLVFFVLCAFGQNPEGSAQALPKVIDVTIEGILKDAEDNPVVNATVANAWTITADSTLILGKTDLDFVESCPVPLASAVTNEAGKFYLSYSIDLSCDASFKDKERLIDLLRGRRTLVAFDQQRTLVAIIAYQILPNDGAVLDAFQIDTGTNLMNPIDERHAQYRLPPKFTAVDVGVAPVNTQDGRGFIFKVEAKNEFRIPMDSANVYAFQFYAKDIKGRYVQKVLEDHVTGPIHPSFELTSLLSDVEGMSWLEIEDILRQRDYHKTLFEEEFYPNLRKTILSQKRVLVYFLANFCRPCFSEDGLASYLPLHNTYKLVAVMSDFYEGKYGSNPENIRALKKKFRKDARWSLIKNRLNGLKAKKSLDGPWLRFDNGFDLTTLSPKLAKAFEIEGYPSYLFFENGKLVYWNTTNDTAVVKAAMKNMGWKP